MGKITTRVLAARIFAVGLIAVLMLTGTAMGEVSRTGLVAEWHFDGDAKDSSGNGNDVNLFNGATFIDGKLGKALSFDGVSGYAETSSVIYLYDKSFTFELWYKNPGVNQQGDPAIISNYNKTGSGSWVTALLHIGGTSSSYVGKIQFLIRGLGGYGGNIYSTKRIDDNQWHHIAGVRDTTTGKAYLYIDGVLDNQAESPDIGIVDSGQKFIIGSGVQDAYTKAIVDEVRIYNRALSANEVIANYEAGQIIITSNPSGAEVIVDGNSKGIASPTLSVDGVSPSTHAVKCKLSGYQDYDTNIVLSASSVASVNCALNPAPTSTPTSTASIQKSTSSSTSSSPIDTTTSVPSPKEPQTESKPLLSLSQDPFTFNFGTMKDGETASQVLSVSNAGGETLTWGISDDQSWITANPTSGINSGTVLININTAGLNPGSYSGTIIVTSNGGTKKGSVLLNIPDTSAAAPALTIAPSAAPVDLPIASPVSLSQIIGVILVLGGLLLTTLTTVKKDISLEVGVSEKTLKYVGGAGVLLVMIGAYMLLKTSGFM